ncbi:MAG: heavy-metal-associated domain-containing protein [Nitrospinaceae bacterium]
MAEKVIHVEGMSCDHCVKTVTEALQELPGVRAVSVDLGKKEVRVEVEESGVEDAEISSKIVAAGFEVVAS